MGARTRVKSIMFVVIDTSRVKGKRACVFADTPSPSCELKFSPLEGVAASGCARLLEDQSREHDALLLKLSIIVKHEIVCRTGAEDDNSL